MLDLATPTAQGLSDLVWLTLLHSVWLGLVIASLASIVGWVVSPGSHRARHLVFLGSLGALALGSLAASIVQNCWDRSPIAPATVIASPMSAASLSLAPLQTPSVVHSQPSPPLAPATFEMRGLFEMAAKTLQTARPVIAAAWAVGAGCFTLTLLAGAHSLRRLRRESTRVERFESRARALGRLLRLRHIPGVRVHHRLHEPCLAGVNRPVVLLPTDWLATATVEEIDAVLAHELSHARRFDHLANLAQRGIEACLFFHPCVHWLSRRARSEAEHAADAFAVRLTGNPSALARSLESVARLRMTRSRPYRFGLAVGGDRHTLVPRIQELLDMKPKRPRPAFWPLAALPAAVMLAWMTTTLGIAQESSAPAPLQDARSRDESRMGDSDRSNEERRLLSAVPWQLSQDDLVKLVRLTSPDVADPSRLSRAELLKLAGLEEITFEIRRLDMETSSWERFRDGSRLRRIEDVGTPDNHRGWLMDEKTMKEVIGAASFSWRVEGNPSAIIQAPKITAWERHSAYVWLPVSPLDDVAYPPPGTPSNPRRPKPRRDASDLDTVQLGIQVTGVRTQSGHRIDALCCHTARVSPTKSPAEAARTSGGPDRVKRVSCDVPAEQTLVMDSGIDSGADQAGGNAFKRLILISPRHYGKLPPSRVEAVPDAK